MSDTIHAADWLARLFKSKRSFDLNAAMTTLFPKRPADCDRCKADLAAAWETT